MVINVEEEGNIDGANLPVRRITAVLVFYLFVNITIDCYKTVTKFIIAFIHTATCYFRRIKIRSNP